MDSDPQAGGSKTRKKGNLKPKAKLPVSPKLSPPHIFKTFRAAPDPVKVREQEEELEKALRLYADREKKKEKTKKMKALQPNLQVGFGVCKAPESMDWKGPSNDMK